MGLILSFNEVFVRYSRFIIKITLFIMFFPFSIFYLIFRKKNKVCKKMPKFVPHALSAAENSHYDYMNEINALYSSVMKSGEYNGALAHRLEQFCWADIKLAPAVWEASKQNCAAPPHYPSYKQLAILYERRGDYARAVDVCKRAIKDGYSDDKTKHGMQGRAERLSKKDSCQI